MLVFKAERKAPAGARVMVAFPKIGSKKARSGQNEDQLQVASVEAIGAKRRRTERKEAYSYFPYVVAVKVQVMNREVLYYM